MTTFDWLICYLAWSPFVFVGLTALYYRLRYRAGIAWQQHFDKGLFK